MSIKVGDHVPDASLGEYIETATDTCAVGPNTFQVSDLVKGKKIAVFAVPGAFTPTCSEQHLPGFLAKADEFKAAGVDEIWCVAVNDAFVMGAWGRSQNVNGKIRLLADGSADWTRKLGLEFDLSSKGLGVRCKRFSALLDDGVVTSLNIDDGGGLDKSDAATLLAQVKA
ncbi:peroxiredoxin [Alcaligenes endophyticus]|uniref:Glutathione-dependent peroxiredoxin n=1 Tax=Alcaligenes endophyticus TaxID=1929088 RepID=A0ABT8EGU6_9BURK|nr:peroxiredoxin [Alcaligenes endophyticus]MCX5589828.1 peroxiredoxin [Alcaligenes endophyticus]MDN4120509.1 peroxiredoxin [Alcaligenes endophyticus]